MKQYINLLGSLPISSRPLEQRSLINDLDKAEHWKLSEGYFDGTRAQGYGGYFNDGRWIPVAKDLSQFYGLEDQATILDIGCAKGFLLDAFIGVNPFLEVWGLDISDYALKNASQTNLINYVLGNAKDLPFDDKSFDLVLSINSLHNLLNINDVIEALREIQRVSKFNSYITVGAYSSLEEKKVIDNWAVVATTYMHENDWLEVFDKAGYTGDYYWFKPNQSFGGCK